MGESEARATTPLPLHAHVLLTGSLPPGFILQPGLCPWPLDWFDRSLFAIFTQMSHSFPLLTSQRVLLLNSSQETTTPASWSRAAD